MKTNLSFIKTARDKIQLVNQLLLPHKLEYVTCHNGNDVAKAIKDMVVRGAPAIGISAAYGMYLTAWEMSKKNKKLSADVFKKQKQVLDAARPTAVNLAWALERLQRLLQPLAPARRAEAAWAEADAIAEEDIAVNRAIGEHGLALLRAIAARKPGPVRVLTHCNAGWLATVGYGTATAPLYLAQEAGLPLHVWVDETRPRNQGASLTAWELGRAGVPHALVADNAGGHLMQHGQVDIVFVGCDRVSARGDVCNKIGTYLKALAAHDNGVPFYVAMPLSTLDRRVHDGLAEIPIEERSAREVTHLAGRDARGEVVEVQISPEGTPAANPAFDVTPARLVSGLITERGIVAAREDAIAEIAHG